MTEGLEVTVLGGDARQNEVVVQFLRLGAKVRIYGLPWKAQVQGATVPANLEDALSGARVIIGPVQAVDEEGNVYTQPGVDRIKLTEGALRKIDPAAVFFVGLGSGYLREACQRCGVNLVEFREWDEFATYNSVPSAEGLIQMAMEASPLTIFGSQCLILGYGRTARTLAWMLRGLGANVTVAARKEKDLASIYAAGFRPLPFDQLSLRIGEADLIFNTVPALVLTRPVIERANPESVILDVASAPGGTDFQAAAERGIRALLAPSLPGKVAPKSAGRIVARVIVRYLENLATVPGRRA